MLSSSIQGTVFFALLDFVLVVLCFLGVISFFFSKHSWNVLVSPMIFLQVEQWLEIRPAGPLDGDKGPH